MRTLQLILIGSQGIACVSIVGRGLASRFPALLFYLAASMARGWALMAYSPKDPAFLQLWIWTAPVMLVLQVALAVEAYRRSLEELPGAQRATHWTIIAMAVLAAGLAQIPQRTETAYGFLSLAYQGVAAILGLTAAFLTALLSYLRPRRRPNAVAHERILAFHLTGLAILLGLLHFGEVGWTSPANGVVSVASCWAWTLCLTRAGEQMPDRPAWNSPQTTGFASLRERLLLALDRRQ